jgi:hypothetical protein
MLLLVCLIKHRRLKYPAHTHMPFPTARLAYSLACTHTSLGCQHLILGCGIRTTDIPNWPDPAPRKQQPITSVIGVCFFLQYSQSSCGFFDNMERDLHVALARIRIALLQLE